MRVPGLAIAWEFGQRHRWGFAALVAYLLLMGATDLLVLQPGRAVSLDRSADLPLVMAPEFAARVFVPVSLFMYYFLAVFTFGLTGDLVARRSMYPARLFPFPVTNAALAFWPMLYGGATMAGLCMAAVRFIIWPSGVDVPIIWPALFAATVLAWTQVLMWLPYGLPGLRVMIAVLWLPAIYLAVFSAAERQVAEPVMIAFLAPQLPLAYLVARLAVAMARRGDVPDWRRAMSRLARIALPSRYQRHPFPSALRAQQWFEWRLHGWSLPVWAAILLPAELALLFVAGPETPALIAYTLAGVLLTPPFMAAFSVPRVRRSNAGGSDGYGMAPFVATRPLTSPALIAAKLAMSAWSTVITWLLILTAIPLALALSGTWPVVAEWITDVAAVIGMPRTLAVLLLGLLGLVATTWNQLVQSLYVGLSGREWLIRTYTCVMLSFLIFIEPIIAWIRGTSGVRIALWNAWPWILATLVVIKVSAGCWMAARFSRTRLLGDRTLIRGAGGWLSAVLAVYAVLVWLLWSPHIPRYVLMLIAILAVPLVRVAAAPLALAGNRHR